MPAAAAGENRADSCRCMAQEPLGVNSPSIEIHSSGELKVRRFLLFIVIALVITIAPIPDIRAQDDQSQERDEDPRTIVQEWLAAWNNLDGSAEATESVVQMFLPDAYHQVGPNPRQIGTVLYEGHSAIRKFTSDFANGNTNIQFRIRIVTANEKAIQLFHVAEGPWGGTSVAVELIGAYNDRETSKRWMSPGAAFFQIQAGKIRWLRLYMPENERMEVYPLVR